MRARIGWVAVFLLCGCTSSEPVSHPDLADFAARYAAAWSHGRSRRMIRQCPRTDDLLAAILP